MTQDDEEQQRFERIADGELAQIAICLEDGGKEAAQDLIQAKLAGIFGFYVKHAHMPPMLAYLLLRSGVDQIGRECADMARKKPGA